MKKYALYVGTEDGYKIEKLYDTELGARLSAKLNKYRFTKKGEYK